MHRLDRIPALDFANERRGDVFSLEFPNRWDAHEARRAAELDGGSQPSPRPTLATGLATVSRRFAPVGRRLDSAATELRRVSRASAR
jgi:hypothetical protein